MNIISVREQPQYTGRIIAYLQQCWNEMPHLQRLYKPLCRCCNHCLSGTFWKKRVNLLDVRDLSPMTLSVEWIYIRGSAPYLLTKIIGVITMRKCLQKKTKEDARKFGFRSLYLSTTHVGYYEKYGFRYIGDGYHPWEEQSRIYEIELQSMRHNQHINPNEVFPSKHKSLCFMKNVVSAPNISIGDYTYYDDPVKPEKF